MPLEHHNLVQEFPEHRERIQVMKVQNGHFARLFDKYDEIEHEVHKIEAGSEAASEDRLEELKKIRAFLKDELYAMLKSAA
jgi:uncharacterized protein YdcH (DUF465 family)